MKNVSQTMSRSGSVDTAQRFRTLMHCGPINRHRRKKARIQINLQVIQHLLPLWLRETFAPVIEMPPNLQAHGLSKLQQEQSGYAQGAAKSRHELIGPGGIDLRPIQCTEEGSVRKTAHPSSPSSSSARIAATSASVKTRSPQIARRRAAKSGFAGSVRTSGRHAVSRPIGCPRFSIRMSSPSESHASSMEKEFRKSRTVTVFIMWTNYVHISSIVNSFLSLVSVSSCSKLIRRGFWWLLCPPVGEGIVPARVRTRELMPARSPVRQTASKWRC